MSLVCSVIFIHHAFNANILDKDYAFSDGEILIREFLRSTVVKGTRV